MKKYLVVLICLSPLLTIAQGKKKSNEKDAAKVERSSEGYKIVATVSGYPDSTVVDLLNGNNRMPENTALVIGGKFTLVGKVEYPDFKLLSFAKSTSYIPMFLDNSNMTLEAQKDNFPNAVIKGSKAHDDFKEFSKVTQPYESMFQQDAVIDKDAAKACIDVLKLFVKNKPESYLSLIAIYRINQLTPNGQLMEELFKSLLPEIQSSPIGGYISQQIDEAKRNPANKVIPDFEMADVDGKMVNIKSYRGKYVLIDFWASWCGPCRGENPNVVNAYNKYKSKNFTVLGISLDKSKEPWIEAINHDGLTWTHVSDLRGWSNAVAQQFGITSIPQNFLIDPSGVVIGKNLRGEALDAKLESILK